MAENNEGEYGSEVLKAMLEDAVEHRLFLTNRLHEIWIELYYIEETLFFYDEDLIDNIRVSELNIYFLVLYLRKWSEHIDGMTQEENDYHGSLFRGVFMTEKINLTLYRTTYRQQDESQLLPLDD
jgi:hypothetical protein